MHIAQAAEALRLAQRFLLKKAAKVAWKFVVLNFRIKQVVLLLLLVFKNLLTVETLKVFPMSTTTHLAVRQASSSS